MLFMLIIAIYNFIQELQMTYTFKTEKHHSDVLIIGSGGAGLAASIFAAQQGLDTIVVSKVHPLKSHTVAAQGGINAVLSNIEKDNWRWHMYDTLKAADWIADTDSVELMCSSASDFIHMLDQLGVEFDRTKDGKINQKVYGGQSTEFGNGGLAYRACYSKDRTGYSIMEKLYNEALRLKVRFYNYNFVLDLIGNTEDVVGAVCWDIENGRVNIINAFNSIIATGGYSQIYSTSTSASICTGDGNGLVARLGLPLQDMEFIQFHPTAINKIGVLITEASRSAGGQLLNSKNERFMSQYAPRFMELAARDVVARAIATEITLGNGCGPNKDYVYLDITHMSKEEIKNSLPTVYENCINFLNIDPSKIPIPISPAAHYTMGGIPTNNNCQVVKSAEEDIIKGLYAIGEAACISVHGAGRLGCNSLLDLLVFAKRAIENIKIEPFKKQEFDIKNILVKFYKIFLQKGNNINNDIEKLTRRLKLTMNSFVGVFRSKDSLLIALDEIEKIKSEFSVANIVQPSLKWNLELQNYLELKNMLVSAKATLESALWREESRGSHWREDFPSSKDEFHVHSLWFDGKVLRKNVRKSINDQGCFQPSIRNY